MREQKVDVVVVGAGPAGSAAAWGLARAGWDVALLERGPSPISKPCGEFLTPGATDILRDELGVLPALLAGGAVPVTRAQVMSHGGQAFHGRTEALSCPRSVTDAAVRSAAVQAGARLVTGFYVRDVLRNGSRICGVQGQDTEGEMVRFSAQVTVGADGTHSSVARALHVVRPLPHLQRIALVGHFLLPPHGACRQPETAVQMYLPADGTDGCCGVGPPCGAEGASNVNIVVPRAEAHKMAGRRDAYFHERLRTAFPAVWLLVQNAKMVGDLQSIGCFGHTTRRATGPGAVLVGDAATFVHPFTGEGVFFALRGAQIAAQVIDNALRADDVSARALSAYDAARKHELVPRYKLCASVQRVTHTPHALAFAAASLKRAPELTDFLFSVLGDRRHPAELLSLHTARLAFRA